MYKKESNRSFCTTSCAPDHSVHKDTSCALEHKLNTPALPIMTQGAAAAPSDDGPPAILPPKLPVAPDRLANFQPSLPLLQGPTAIHHNGSARRVMPAIAIEPRIDGARQTCHAELINRSNTHHEEYSEDGVKQAYDVLLGNSDKANCFCFWFTVRNGLIHQKNEDLHVPSGLTINSDK
jgi:hypothetical protein